MFDRYESFVLLGKDISTTSALLTTLLSKAFLDQTPAPIITNTGDTIKLSFPEISFVIKFITEKNSVEEKSVMAQYFGTERGDLDEIAKINSYVEISSTQPDTGANYAQSHQLIIQTLESLGKSWSLTPDGYINFS